MGKVRSQVRERFRPPHQPRHCLLRVNKGRSAPDGKADPVATLSCPTLRNGPVTLQAFLFPDIFKSRRRVDQLGQIKDYKTIVSITPRGCSQHS